MLALSLSSCSTTSIPQKFDNVPGTYMVVCQDPKKLIDDSIAGLIEAIRENAEQYTECKTIHNGLVEILNDRIY
jgi:hypothetical protein